MTTAIERLGVAQYMPPTSLRVFHTLLHERVGIHWHEFYELALIVHGRAEHVLNGVAYTVGPGSVFLLTPADFHELVPQPGPPVELFNVIFCDDMLGDELEHLVFERPHDHRAEFTGAPLDALRAEFQRLWSEETSGQAGRQLVMRGALQRILIDLARHERTNPAPADERPITIQQPAIRKALIFLHHHFRTPLTLQDVARQVNLSPNYFSECFHRTVGTCFQTYLQQLRLRFARAMLTASQLPITDICFASGFSSLSHFQRVWKQAYGQSARAVRQHSLRHVAPGDRCQVTTQA